MLKSLGAKTLNPTAPVWIVGTYDAEGRPNVMAASWAGICCSKPPCLYVALREATYSHAALKARGAYTVSVPAARHAKEADTFGIVSGRDGDKFAMTGLTPVRSELVDAPYVGEFPLVYECRVVRTVGLGLHTMFVGEILDVKADEDVLDEKGLFDVAALDPFVYCAGAHAYHALGRHLGRSFTLGRPPS